MAFLSWWQGFHEPVRRVYWGRTLRPGTTANRGEEGGTPSFGAMSCVPLRCALALTFSAVSLQAAPSIYSEYEVKAAFLYNFTKFVEWPEESMPDGDDPVTIGILGDDPFGSVLDELVKGKTVKGRAIAVKRSKDVADLKKCQIIFIGASEQDRLKEVFTALKNLSVLTVGDVKGFAEKGGTANLTMAEGKVRVEINMDAAKNAHLKISSQLLKLAKLIEGQSQEQG